MNTNVIKVKKLVLTGALSALIIVLGITKLGLLPIGPAASISLLQIPVIIAACLAGLPSALFTGAVFGILSLIQAAMSPSGVLDPLFVNPLCSVLPRVITGFVAWGLWVLLSKFKKLPKAVSAGITGFVATAAHTMLVIGCLYLFAGTAVREGMGGAGYFAVLAALSFNAVLEALASTIVCSAVFVGLFISEKKKSKLSDEQD